MVVTREDLNPCTVQLQIVCEPDEVGEGFKKAYKGIAKSLKIPGFRPGHAPRALLDNVIDKGQLYDAAAEEIVRKTLGRAVQEQELRPDTTTSPVVSLSSLDQDAGRMEYTAKIPLPPQVELGEYKGLPLEKPRLDVTDEEVDFQLDEFRKRRATREVVTERGVQEGDIVVVSLKADGEAEGRSMMVVAGGSFPALDEALTGMRAEEIKSSDLEFPADFQETSLAGAVKHVQIAITSVSAPILPDVDDAFAKSLQTENVEDLRAKIKDGVREAKENMIRDVSVGKLLDTLLERSKVEVSDPMWENLASRRLNEVAQEQAQQGKTLEAYAGENGMTVDEYAGAWFGRARLEVQRALLIQGIFAKENIQLANEDLNAELYVMAREFGTDPESMFNTLRENNALDELQFRSISRRVGQILLDSAEVTEVDALGDVELPDPTETDEVVAEIKAKKPRAKKAAVVATPEADATETVVTEEAPAAE